MINRDIFDELFVLELANNHWGDVNRGLRIIREFGTVVRYNDVRAAIKLQLRDVDTFIHKDFLERKEVRYIKTTLDTRLSREDMAALVEAIRRAGCVRVATPFDDKSVEACVELGIEIIKVASSDITDWPLLEKIAKTRKPVVVSTGGASLKDTDDMVTSQAAAVDHVAQAVVARVGAVEQVDRQRRIAGARPCQHLIVQELPARQLTLLQRNRQVVVVWREHVAGRQVLSGVHTAHQRVQVLEFLLLRLRLFVPRLAAHQLGLLERLKPLCNLLRRRAIGREGLVLGLDVDVPLESARALGIGDHNRGCPVVALMS